MGDQIKQFTISAAICLSSVPKKPVKVGETWDMTDVITEAKDPDEPKAKGDEKPRTIKGKVTTRRRRRCGQWRAKVGTFKTVIEYYR